MGKLFGKKNDDGFEKGMDALEAIGARIDAGKNNICRPPSEVDHLQKTYETAYPQVLNGETSGIHVRQNGNDGTVQELIVTFGKRAYSPAHTHPHYSVVEVLEGTVTDSVRDKVFKKGEWYLTGPNEVHSSQSFSGAVIRVFNTADAFIAREIFSAQKYIKRDKLKIKEAG